MAREFTTTLGSGTIPHVGAFYGLDFVEGTFPVPSKTDPRTRTGTGAVILNPEDFSVFMAVKSRTITVTTTAVPLPVTPLENRRALVIHNNGSVAAYIGGSDVTAANGLPLAAAEKIAIDIQGNSNVAIYAITGSTADIRILELA